ncbi:hypothetical protein ACHAPV_004739 [Trichoderma viride]
MNYDEQTIQERNVQIARKKELRNQEVREYQNRVTAMQAEKAKTRNPPNTNPTTLRWVFHIIDSPHASTTSVPTPSPTTKNRFVNFAAQKTNPIKLGTATTAQVSVLQEAVKLLKQYMRKLEVRVQSQNAEVTSELQRHHSNTAGL